VNRGGERGGGGTGHLGKGKKCRNSDPGECGLKARGGVKKNRKAEKGGENLRHEFAVPSIPSYILTACSSIVGRKLRIPEGGWNQEVLGKRLHEGYLLGGEALISPTSPRFREYGTQYSGSVWGGGKQL